MIPWARKHFARFTRAWKRALLEETPLPLAAELVLDDEEPHAMSPRPSAAATSPAAITLRRPYTLISNDIIGSDSWK